jgi:hypothetical protein
LKWEWVVREAGAMARACSLASLIAPLLPFSHHLLAASRATDSADDAFMSHPEPTRASKKQVIAPMSETPEEFRQRVDLIDSKFYEDFEKRGGPFRDRGFEYDKLAVD